VLYVFVFFFLCIYYINTQEPFHLEKKVVQDKMALIDIEPSIPDSITNSLFTLSEP